jgi:hypothetical protein
MQGVFMEGKMLNCYIILNDKTYLSNSSLNINSLHFNINISSKKVALMLYNIEN